MALHRSEPLRKYMILTAVLGCVFGSTGVARAVPVGAIAFDVFVVGPGGTNAFFLSNITGGSAAPPVFPISTPLTFLGSSLTLVPATGPAVPPLPLGDIGPGPLTDPSGDPPSSLQFADTVKFLSATLTATISPTIFHLSDGTTFLPGSTAISATLVPSLGSSLVPGDNVALEVTGKPQRTPVPEATNLLLVGSGLALLKAPKRSRNGRV